MNLWESTRIATAGINANRMRGALTMLGILIGVGAVIMLVAVGAGSSKAVEDQLSDLGTNTITVFRRPTFGRTATNAAGTTSRNVVLNFDDVADLEDPLLAPSITEVAPVVSSSVTGSYEGATMTPSQFVGTTANYMEITNWKVASGRGLDTNDVDDHRKVVVVGSTVVDELFGGVDPVGKSVRFGGATWDVIGVLEPKGSNGIQDQDSIVIAPYTSVQDSITGRATGLSSLTVQAVDAEQTTSAQAEVEAVLFSNHDLTAQTSPFLVLNQASLVETSNETNEVFTVLLGAVAGISLLVGGIGVMNIMLVTVTERTREIGTRKAVGARRVDILGQFLIEAVLLAMIGGGLGVIAGVAGSQFEIVGVEPVVQMSSIVLAFSVAVAIGVFFGSYPASRAAKLRPIEALRYE